MDNSIIRFFQTYLNEDVSNIYIVNKDMKNKQTDGYYNTKEHSVIYVNSQIKGLYRELVIVHEITHIMQYERNKSYTMVCGKVKVGAIADFDNVMLPYEERRHEIDACLMEALYIYDVCGVEGLCLQLPYIYKNCVGKLSNNKICAIYNMPDSIVKTFLLQTFDIEEEEIIS